MYIFQTVLKSTLKSQSNSSTDALIMQIHRQKCSLGTSVVVRQASFASEVLHGLGMTLSFVAFLPNVSVFIFLIIIIFIFSQDTRVTEVFFSGVLKLYVTFSRSMHA
jgi:hypothetical protein